MESTKYSLITPARHELFFSRGCTFKIVNEMIKWEGEGMMEDKGGKVGLMERTGSVWHRANVSHPAVEGKGTFILTVHIILIFEGNNDKKSPVLL